RDAFETMAGLADILLPSLQDLQRLYGETDGDRLASRLVELGAREFAITAEDAPCLVYHGAIARIPPPPVAAMVDTSGAGDSFNGAYLAARLRDEPATAAARAGLALAAHVVTQPGAIAGQLST